jgi:hypothetical protein
MILTIVIIVHHHIPLIQQLYFAKPTVLWIVYNVTWMEYAHHVTILQLVNYIIIWILQIIHVLLVQMHLLA